MRNFKVLCFVLLINIPVLYSQFDFREGYIINNTNDTIYGWIDYAGNKANAKKCLFKPSLKEKIQTYTPEQIKAYRFVDSKYYVTKTIQVGDITEQVFLEYLINGIVDIYYYRDNKGEHYLVDNGDSNLLPLRNEEKEVFIDSKKYVGQTYEYRQTLKGVFIKSPTISKKVDNTSLNHKSLIKISQAYHQEVCFDEECIVYEKKIVKAKRQFGALLGANFTSISNNSDLINTFNYFKNGTLESTVSPAVGLFYKRNFPKINERINLQYAASISFLSLKGSDTRQEALYNFTQTNQITLKRTLLNNTLLLKYEFPQGKLRPTFQIGGFINYALSTDYERDYELIDTNGNTFQSEFIIESPFSQINTGIVLGVGFNFTAFKTKEVFVDFNYRKTQLLKDFEGLHANVFLIQLGLPIGN